MKIVLSLFILLAVSSCSSEPSLEEIKNDFFNETDYDKRTTLLFIKSDTEILVQDEEVASQFIQFYHKNSFIPNLDLNVYAYNGEAKIIKNSVASMRSEPKHSAELATQYLMGQEVTIIEKIDEDWYYVQGEDGYLGYMNKGAVASKTIEWDELPKVRIESNEGIAYNEQGEVITDLVFGNLVAKMDYGYLLPDLRQVQIPDNCFIKNESTDTIDLIMNRAYSLMGRPYIWGGTSVKAMDCSGFTRMAFLEVDYLLGRDASLQVLEGEEVSLNPEDWQRGDLLFFGTLREDGSQRITHVAIHEKDGRFIHCSQRVRVESLNESHPEFNEDRLNTLLRVKRIF